MRTILRRPDDFPGYLARPFQQFFRKEAASSLLLLGAFAAALLWANLLPESAYDHFWESEITVGLGHWTLVKTVREWIAEGLVGIFFFTVGLEIKREILVGELATLKKALFPVSAALGGMAVPAFIYLAFNRGLPGEIGWGIPMATDIAFALGALSLLGSRIPLGLRIFLSAFAIADDLGSVFVIAVFYTKEIATGYLLVSGIIIVLLMLANFFWVRNAVVYALLATALWFAVLGSGVHATVTGIAVALCIPARGRFDTDVFLERVSDSLRDFQCGLDGCGYSILQNEQHLNAVQAMELACHHVETPLQRLEHGLHPWVAFGVIPLFALANAGIDLRAVDAASSVVSPVAWGITLGLLLGKPLGIVLFCAIAVRLGLASLPTGVTWGHIAGAGILGGIGFTVSLFVTGLSFSDPGNVVDAKLGILVGSVIAAAAGLVVLRSVPAPE